WFGCLFAREEVVVINILSPVSVAVAENLEDGAVVHRGLMDFQTPWRIVDMTDTSTASSSAFRVTASAATDGSPGPSGRLAAEFGEQTADPCICQQARQRVAQQRWQALIPRWDHLQRFVRAVAGTWEALKAPVPGRSLPGNGTSPPSGFAAVGRPEIRPSIG